VRLLTVLRQDDGIKQSQITLTFKTKAAGEAVSPLLVDLGLGE
jgi:hypothetical protein